MKDYERLKMMEYPKDRIDLVIDTDAATEIDDQFAIAYALLSGTVSYQRDLRCSFCNE